MNLSKTKAGSFLSRRGEEEKECQRCWGSWGADPGKLNPEPAAGTAEDKPDSHSVPRVSEIGGAGSPGRGGSNGENRCDIVSETNGRRLPPTLSRRVPTPPYLAGDRMLGGWGRGRGVGGGSQTPGGVWVLNAQTPAFVPTWLPEYRQPGLYIPGKKFMQFSQIPGEANQTKRKDLRKPALNSPFKRPSTRLCHEAQRCHRARRGQPALTLEQSSPMGDRDQKHTYKRIL